MVAEVEFGVEFCRRSRSVRVGLICGSDLESSLALFLELKLGAGDLFVTSIFNESIEKSLQVVVDCCCFY